MIKLDLALNPFKKGKKTEVEGVKKVEVEMCSDIEKAIEQHSNIDTHPNNKKERLNYGPFKTSNVPVLSPAKINYFLDCVIEKDEIKTFQFSKLANALLPITNDFGDLTSKYVSSLIQASYNNGYNDFHLKCNAPLSWFAENLTGKTSSPLSVTIHGDLGNNLGIYSRNTHINLDGNAGTYCGDRTLYSRFIINGNTDHYCGHMSKYSRFMIYGNTGASLAIFAYKCGFHIEKDILQSRTQNDMPDGHFFSRGSLFQTSNKDLYERLKDYVVEVMYSTVRLVDTNGKKLEEIKLEAKH